MPRVRRQIAKLYTVLGTQHKGRSDYVVPKMGCFSPFFSSLRSAIIALYFLSHKTLLEGSKQQHLKPSLLLRTKTLSTPLRQIIQKNHATPSGLSAANKQPQILYGLDRKGPCHSWPDMLSTKFLPSRPLFSAMALQFGSRL